MDDEQWGPWVAHNGSGCPCKGQYVHTVFANGQEKKYIAWTDIHLPGRSDCDVKTSRWAWVVPNGYKIVRYRIRKPRGLTLLEGILAEVTTEQPRVYVDVEV